MNPEPVNPLEFIQGIVNRLGGNSFSPKGWCVALVAALFALAAKETNPLYAALAAVPAMAFWGLDAYDVQQERLFRKFYDRVRISTTSIDPFSMEVGPIADEVDG